jgi:hypothetical protein
MPPTEDRPPMLSPRKSLFGASGPHRHHPEREPGLCLVCARPATWRIERLLGSYTVCDWCESIIRAYDQQHPEFNQSRHVRVVT